jgi:hypothetical protein
MFLVFLRLRRRVGWPRDAKNWIWKNGQRTMRDATQALGNACA